MTLDTFKREQLRLALLRVQEANRTRWGLTAAALRVMVGRWSLHPSTEEVEAEVLYLQDKGFSELVGKVISPENRAWRITAAGRDFLAEQPEA